MFSQSNVLKWGYYINEEGDTVKSLIQTKRWINSPEDIKVKQRFDDDYQTLTIDEIRGFGVPEDGLIFERKNVAIDYSKGSEIFIDDKIIEKDVLLRTIVSGEFSLYELNDGKFQIFFFENPTNNIEQLDLIQIQKSAAELEVNSLFQNQINNIYLLNDLKQINLERVDYQRNELADVFVDINNKLAVSSTNEAVRYGEDEGVFQELYITPLIGMYSHQARATFIEDFDEDFDATTSFRYGGQFELRFRETANKFGVNIEVTRTKIENSKQVTFRGNEETARYEFSSTQTAIGPQYSIFKTDQHDVFLGLNALVAFTNDQFSGFELDPAFTINPSLTYRLNQKIHAELNYLLDNEYSADNDPFTLELGNQIALMVGYSF